MVYEPILNPFTYDAKLDRARNSSLQYKILNVLDFVPGTDKDHANIVGCCA